MTVRKWLQELAFEAKLVLDECFSSPRDPVEEYVRMGLAFARCVKDLPEFGYRDSYMEMFERWRQAEVTFVRCGYRSKAFDEFFEANSVEDLSPVEYREKLEEPVLHAELYRERWLRREQFSPSSDGCHGYFVPPSTRRFVKFDV